jgi:cytochrome b pre-mRNA-processing protein 3
MDINLREMGVSDLAVGRRVRTMWEAFHGRAQAYEAALQAGDAAGLAAALHRNVWRAEGKASPEAGRLAVHALRAAEALASQPIATLLRGEALFPAPEVEADAA